MTQFYPKFSTVVLCLFLTFPSFAKKQETKTSFVLYFHALINLKKPQTKAYISELRALLANGRSKSFEPLLVEAQSLKRCGRKSPGSCLKTLYGTKACVPAKQKVSRYCFKKSQDVPETFFTKPVFSRLDWNRFAIGMNKLCNSHDKEPVCHQLARLHEIYMKAFQKKLKPKKLNKVHRSTKRTKTQSR